MKLFNRFYSINEYGITKKDILNIDSDAELSNFQDDFNIKNVATINNAKEGDLTFFVVSLVSGEKYKNALTNTKASYCLLKKQYANIPNKNVKTIITEEPYIVFVRLCEKLLLEVKNIDENQIDNTAKISKLAKIGNGVKIGKNVIIEDFVKIGDGVEIGDNTNIKSGVKILDNCKIGNNCVFFENCVIRYSEIGNDCIFHSGCCIGQDGFGFVFNRKNGKNERITHFSYVKIGNSVEIRANTCIDRGVFEPTIIDDNVKIDNLVQIGHNVKVGAGTMMAGQTGIAGSAEIGKYCMFGGKSGMAGHITLGDQCILYGATNISKSFPKHTKIIGTPGETYYEWINKYTILQYFLSKKSKIKKKENNNGFFSKIYRGIVSGK